MTERHFRVVQLDGKKVEFGGVSITSKASPGSAARKLLTSIAHEKGLKKNKKASMPKVKFCIQEYTQGSSKKIYGPYVGHFHKYTAAELKKAKTAGGKIKFTMKPVVKLVKRKNNMKGGHSGINDDLQLKACIYTALDGDDKFKYGGRSNKTIDFNPNQRATSRLNIYLCMFSMIRHYVEEYLSDKLIEISNKVFKNLVVDKSNLLEVIMNKGLIKYIIGDNTMGALLLKYRNELFDKQNVHKKNIITNFYQELKDSKKKLAYVMSADNNSAKIITLEEKELFNPSQFKEKFKFVKHEKSKNSIQGNGVEINDQIIYDDYGKSFHRFYLEKENNVTMETINQPEDLPEYNKGDVLNEKYEKLHMGKDLKYFYRDIQKILGKDNITKYMKHSLGNLLEISSLQKVKNKKI